MDRRQRTLGVVLPSNNTILEAELAAMLPPQLKASFSRITAIGAGADALLTMSATAVGAVDELAAADVDLMLYACLSTSLARGASWDGEFSAEMEARTGRPCFTAAAATVSAVHAVGARRIGLVTPYPEEIDQLLLPFLAGHGIDVVAHTSLRISDIHEVCRKEPSEVAELARSLEGDFDAVVTVATDLRTIGVIDALERDLGVPVVTTNQAMAWIALDTLGYGEPVAGYGTLLARRPHVGAHNEAKGRC